MAMENLRRKQSAQTRNDECIGGRGELVMQGLSGRYPLPSALIDVVNSSIGCAVTFLLKVRIRVSGISTLSMGV